METRICKKQDCRCQNPQPLNEFTRNKTICNDCVRCYYRNYALEWKNTSVGKKSRERNNKIKRENRQTERYEQEKARIRERWQTDKEFRQKEKERARKWRESEQGQKWLKEWHQSQEYKEYHKKYRDNYYKTEAYQQASRKYQQSEKWRKMTQKRDAQRRALEANAPGFFTQDEWEALCAKKNYCCLACGKKGKLTIDHVIPLSEGGINSIDNIQPLCKSCNSRKGAQTIDYR